MPGKVGVGRFAVSSIVRGGYNRRVFDFWEVRYAESGAGLERCFRPGAG